MADGIYQIPLQRIDGKADQLGNYAGKVLLVVNVASKCGLTPQYTGLEQLYQSRRAAGLEVLGFPSNDFKGQEPGSEAEIQQFCSTSYDVHFPLFAKIPVLGTRQHPLYSHLTRAHPRSTGEGPFRKRLQEYGIESASPTDVLWNFEKFLISRTGAVVGRFAPDVTAEDSQLLTAIDAELAKPAA